jgi:flavin reductase (DIM6/NTAB) family NADH-FMN oxidoreductase RutF
MNNIDKIYKTNLRAFMKKEIEINKAYRLVEPGCVVLVTSGNLKNPNVMTFSWQTPINISNPPLILLVIHRVRYSYELIKQNNELVINIPGEDLLEQTHYVGRYSGKDRDKFKEAGLTPVPSKMVEPPLIDECSGHLECRVVEVFETKTHDLLVCEVVRAVADSDLFDGENWVLEKFHPLNYLGGNKYGILERTAIPKTVKI